MSSPQQTTFLVRVVCIFDGDVPGAERQAQDEWLDRLDPGLCHSATIVAGLVDEDGVLLQPKAP